MNPEKSFIRNPKSEIRNPFLLADRLLRHFLRGSLDFRGGAEELSLEALELALERYRHLVGAGWPALPLNVVLDLGQLLQQGHAFPFASLAAYDTWTETERTVRLAYENRFLNAFLQEPGFQRVVDLLAQSDRPEGPLRRALELLLEPLRPQSGPVVVDLDALRGLSLSGGFDPRAERSQFEAEIEQPGFFAAWVEKIVDLYTAGNLFRDRFHDEDFHELEHFHVYDQASKRLRGRQTQEVARLIGAFDRRRTRRREEAPEVETELPDVGYYPTGGLAEIARQGSLENLVRSELVYLDEGDPDLFTVRYLEGEMLYYQRDSGQLQRQRRTVHALLKASPALRLKHPHHPYHLEMLLSGFLLRLTWDLLALFPRGGVRVCLHFLPSDRSEEEEEAAALLALLLRNEIEHGLVQVSCTAGVDEAHFLDPFREVHVLTIADASHVGESWLVGWWAGGLVGSAEVGSRQSNQQTSKPANQQTSKPANFRQPTSQLLSANPPTHHVLRVGDPAPPASEDVLVLPVQGDILAHLAEVRDRLIDRIAGVKA
jgi:hypothetical protein